MVLTLHKYIFRELLKVFVPTVVALTLILSLGSILRPMQEYGVGPRQAVHLMGYFLPITLTFVLPIAALFAGALVYGRFAGDNELDACKASGISFIRLAYPGLALALLVAGANLILSFHVTPIFVHLAEKSLKADAKQILFRNIQRRGYYELDRYKIYADYADRAKDVLAGVVVVEVKSRQIRETVVVDTAKVMFIRRGDSYEVRIVAHHPYRFGLADEEVGSAEWLPFTWEMGSLLADDIKFKRVDQMQEIRVDPMQFGPVEKLARQTCAQFVTELLAQDIKRTIRNSPPEAGLYELLGEPNSVRFTTGQCTARETEVELSGGVTVSEYDADNGQLLRTLQAEKASLYIEGDELAPTLTMNILSAREMGSGQLRMRHVIRGLVPSKAVTDTFKSGNILADLHPQVLSSSLKDGPSLHLSNFAGELQRRIRKTLVEIGAEIRSRLAFGIGCVPMIMIGIGLGVIKRGGHMLSAFAASCVPAAVLIVCIISGKHITENLGSQAISGILLTWGGLAVLTMMMVVMYRRLLRH